MPLKADPRNSDTLQQLAVLSRRLDRKYGQPPGGSLGEAWLGLVAACNSFDPLQNTDFHYYAMRRIRGHVFDQLSREQLGSRRSRRLMLFFSEAQDISVQMAQSTESDPVDAVASEEAVNSILRICNQDDREVFRLRALQGLDYKRISERVGVSVKTARMRYSRALDDLRFGTQPEVIECKA